MPDTERGRAWIVVANRSGARIYEADTLRAPLRAVRNFERLEGRAHTRDLTSDRPGRAFDSHGPGRHAMEVAVDPREELARKFAREIAGAIEDGRLEGRFDRLVLVAGPHFLGLVRSCLTAATARLLAAEIAKNLGDLDAETLDALHERLSSL